MKITIQIRSVYGNRRFYPMCEKSKLFCDMLETVTLSHNAIDCIKELGYEIELKAETI